MSDRFFLGTRKGVFTVDRKAAGDWRITHAAHLGDNCSIVCPDAADGSLYAALGHGHFGVKLHRSTDAGKTWKEVTAPAFPAKPADAPVVKCPMRGIEIPWTVDMIWSFEAVPSRDGKSSTLWCGTIPGGLFRSRDAGQSWELIRSLWDRPERARWMGGGMDMPGIHSIAADPRDPAKLAIAISCGGVWKSDDDGASWRCDGKGMRNAYMPPDQAYDPIPQDPHRMVRCAGAPDHLWVQHHNGIFRSTDNAANWTELNIPEESLFGFAVAVHPKDPNTAWFVPANSDQKRIPIDGKVYVTRTRDGGKTLQPLRKGLPQDHAYDIVFRHCLDIDNTGNRLVIGSTTGGVWVSEDQGDAWHKVAEHLPPVYCTRFA